MLERFLGGERLLSHLWRSAEQPRDARQAHKGHSPGNEHVPVRHLRAVIQVDDAVVSTPKAISFKGFRQVTKIDSRVHENSLSY